MKDLMMIKRIEQKYNQRNQPPTTQFGHKTEIGINNRRRDINIQESTSDGITLPGRRRVDFRQKANERFDDGKKNREENDIHHRQDKYTGADTNNGGNSLDKVEENSNSDKAINDIYDEAQKDQNGGQNVFDLNQSTIHSGSQVEGLDPLSRYGQNKLNHVQIRKNQREHLQKARGG